MNPWHPMTKPVDLKHLGKLAEELGECQSAVARCIIQGIEEYEPITRKSNRKWLEEEIADVMANLALVIAHFNLDKERMSKRVDVKSAQYKLWHEMA